MGYITKKRIMPATTKNKMLISSGIGVILFAIVAVTIFTDPVLLFVTHYCRIEYGSTVYQLLSQETDCVHLSSYLFNITNGDRFLSGMDEKLKVEEVGPFTYQENRTNEQLTIDKDAGIMSYLPKYRVTFLPEESIGNPKDIQVVMPNVAMLSMASGVSSSSFFVKSAFNFLTNHLSSKPIVKMSAQDYLWGYDEPLIRMGNTFLPGWIDFNKLGLLDRLYQNITYKIEVSTRPINKLTIKSVNGSHGLNKLGYDDPKKRTKCNSFDEVYEGIGYPPVLNKSRPLRLYRSILCRFYDLVYVDNKQTDYGVDTWVYKFSNKTYTKGPENDCLCSRGICQEGVSDMSPCFYGLPVVLSNAHFLSTDPSIYERIQGMKPNEEQHGSEFLIDPYTGMILNTKFSVQVNVIVEDVTFNSRVGKFSNMVVPVAYFKIMQPKVPPETIASLKFIRNKAPYILLGIQFLLSTLGFVCFLYSARVLYMSWIYATKNDAVLETLTSEGTNSKDAKSLEPLLMR